MSNDRTNQPAAPHSESSDSPSDPTQSASNRLFDLRELIAGLFILFGVILVITGFLDGPDEIAKAAGVRINLWTGIGMVVLGLVFVVWRVTRPLKRENLVPDDGADDSSAPQDPIAGH